MILIVDSGATKADWIALSESGEKLFFTQTLGLSPEVLTEETLLSASQIIMSCIKVVRK